ncbi:Elongator complex protein 4 [Hypsizygus marmoreus]|uniref:Elongator complex protein 4 n=1 Tax=Hypsizygus marmoreus TaxID=39966 RepID=A0A369KDV1_HYPMA|nr:Elongator complex protein 4 [Hypsizygus marmoreus]
MSSFKRKGTGKQAPTYPGTRPSPSSSSTIITSTGIPSLDDILGGGLPLSCSLVIAAPDLHSSYGELVQKYFIAQGLTCGHRLFVIDDDADRFVKSIMWTPGSGKATLAGASTVGEDDEQSSHQDDKKITIAWRYESMKPFQTTVSASTSNSTDDYCHNFDLTTCVPPAAIEGALQSGQLACIAIRFSDPDQPSTVRLLHRVIEILKPERTTSSSLSPPIRICIPSLGSPQWGELTRQDILYFLHSLKYILRQHPHACASVSLAPHISTDSWGGTGWLQKLGWVTDATLSLIAFSANPSLTSIFPSHHGLLHIHSLPAPHTLLPPSDKFSSLRGLAASAGSTGGGENNLTFKSTRKRLVFETLHLDIEGGVGERRTTPATTTFDGVDHAHDHASHAKLHKSAVAAVEVVLEDFGQEKPSIGIVDKAAEGLQVKPRKQKKSVAFRADRPDLYDF